MTASSVDPATFCAAPATVEFSFDNGASGRFHYQWVLTVEGTQGSLAFTAGAAPDQESWSEAFALAAGEAGKICGVNVETVQSGYDDPAGSDGPAGGDGDPSGSATVTGSTGTWSQPVGPISAASLHDTLAAGYIPFDSWDSVFAKYQQYLATS